MKELLNKLKTQKGLSGELIRYIILALIIVVGGIIVLFILKTTLFSRISVDKLEIKMEMAAKNYYADNKDLLPVNDKDISTVTISELVNNGYLKSLDKLLKDKSLSCGGEVTVAKNENHYFYSPNLNCGNAYQTKKLYEAIIEPQNIVTEKDGLYKIDNDYVYRGEKVNNYIKFAGQLWRILRVNGSDNSVKLIQVDTTKDKYVWDDRYNTEKERYYGINNYDVSRLKDTIAKYWEGNKIFEDKYKAYIVTSPVCIGPRAAGSTDKTSKTDCVNTNGMYSLNLPLPSDYFIVSLDKGCTKIYNSECTNYNYIIDLAGSTWSTVVSTDNTYSAYELIPYVLSNKTNVKSTLRFVVNISSLANYNGGSGTLSDPYTIK